VFLTHTHRDHVGAWRLVRHAEFHIAAAERSRLVGDTAHRGWIPKLADRIKRPALPRARDLNVRTFSQDTSFVVGNDTVRAYLVPGHTAGSAVYLFRGVLFLGDAATYSLLRGFASAKRGYSDDARVAAENLGRLWPRLRFGDVQYVCTAHAYCAPFSGRFVLDVAH
jgi:glyoxylase-like metal-dependent hydrolase (beta-lactamase superfamily II)